VRIDQAAGMKAWFQATPLPDQIDATEKCWLKAEAVEVCSVAGVGSTVDQYQEQTGGTGDGHQLFQPG